MPLLKYINKLHKHNKLERLAAACVSPLPLFLLLSNRFNLRKNEMLTVDSGDQSPMPRKEEYLRHS